MNNGIATSALPAPKQPGPVSAEQTPREECSRTACHSPATLSVTLLTGGGDRPYALGLATALAREGIHVDFIGSDELESAELRASPRVSFLNLRGSQVPNANPMAKVFRLTRYYLRLVAYATSAKPGIFHILWNNKFRLVDRVLLMLLYRALGRKVLLTAHNVNTEARDGCDSWLNRLTLRTQYRLCSHIFVHTRGMKGQLVQEPYALPPQRVTVIPFGINNTVPNTALDRCEARKSLGIDSAAKVLLFFGNIAPYKGLEFLLRALRSLSARDPSFKLVIAGRPKGHEGYWAGLKQEIATSRLEQSIIQRIEFVPDEQIEVFFKAADVLILPYTNIFQSGVLFLGYSFGLPVIATDVGDLKEDILEGKTGFVCRPQDPQALATAIVNFFNSELALPTAERRRGIQAFANENYSWSRVASITRAVYEST